MKGKRLRWALLGVGQAGKVHYFALREADLNLVGFASQDGNALSGNFANIHSNLLPAGHGGLQDISSFVVEEDWLKLVERSDVDVVLCALPTPMHNEVALAAKKHGKHVLVEKPMAGDAKSAFEMLRAFDRSDLKLGVGQILPHFSAFGWLVDKMKDPGELGQLMELTMWRQIPIVDEECTAKALKACGGWAYDLCVHDAHLVAMGCGFPTAVNSEGQFMHEQPLHLTTSYRFGGNDAPKVTTICGATDGVEGFMHEFDAKFESGQTAVFRGNKLCVGGEDVTGTLPSGDTIDVFARQVEAFDAHCRDEGPIGAADPKLAAQTLRILEAQIQSAESASWKDVTVQ